MYIVMDSPMRPGWRLREGGRGGKGLRKPVEIGYVRAGSETAAVCAPNSLGFSGAQKGTERAGGSRVHMRVRARVCVCVRACACACAYACTARARARVRVCNDLGVRARVRAGAQARAVAVPLRYIYMYYISSIYCIYIYIEYI